MLKIYLVIREKVIVFLHLKVLKITIVAIYYNIHTKFPLFLNYLKTFVLIVSGSVMVFSFI